MMVTALITGGNGFIGKNLQVALKEHGCQVLLFSHKDAPASLVTMVKSADVVYHLAGVNRPLSDDEFTEGNTDFTAQLIDTIAEHNPQVKLIYSSSAQAEKDNPYGRSKLAAEKVIFDAVASANLNACVYRLPGVFGKWCRPNYNSVVATFCHNVIHNLPLRVDSPEHILELVYIDDVIETFAQYLNRDIPTGQFCDIPVKYTITLQALADKITAFKHSRDSLVTDAVGQGITRALYATYLSYLPADQFAYPIPVYEDPRGQFSELLKTPSHGQFSFFTAKPGIVRGGHYHHTKNEKFIVVSGKALFRFEHIISGEVVELETCADHIQVVETIPGWAHNIKNTGTDDLIVMLWANEIFDRSKPDTTAWSM
ncbi:UDP-2-acetamido-2,6-beta-L-arabino-hexul-4-ose reductase [Erwinia sp. V71]|uniref:UDP-2-acetamido-2,6-beta-L-arabino-hexul-4-ose reductase n=1 Tax=Erwinia sp. V71 TaxID=3369424 RepID=UPI003F608407